MLKWAYGVTTVPERISDLLPKTLKSLFGAGFDRPRLFVDGAADASTYRDFGLEVTTRSPRIRTAGNWWLALIELYVRQPEAHRYAIFQDDLLAYKNLRYYLDACLYPANGYWNLLTFPSNHGPEAHGGKVPSVFGEPEKVGWAQGRCMSAAPDGPQNGRGAVALVFDRGAVLQLLTSRHWAERPLDPHRGHRSVDGGVVTALNKAGWREYVHNPSLVQHTGLVSSMGSRQHPQAPAWRGEDFDARELIQEVGSVK
jgi:hypothetical protein